MPSEQVFSQLKPNQQTHVRWKEFLWAVSPGDEQALPAGLRVLGEPREALAAWSCGDVEVSSPLRQDTCRAAYSESETPRLWERSGYARLVSGCRMNSSAPCTRLRWFISSKLQPWPPQSPVWSLSVCGTQEECLAGGSTTADVCVPKARVSVPPASQDKDKVRRGWSSTPRSW